MSSSSPNSHDNALIPRLLAALVAAVCRAPWTVLIVSSVLSVVSAWAFYTRLEIAPSAQRFDQSQKRLPATLARLPARIRRRR